jgi:hypothetical protein
VYGSSGWLTDRKKPRNCAADKNCFRSLGNTMAQASTSQQLGDGLDEQSGSEVRRAMTDRGHYNSTSKQSSFDPYHASGSRSLRAQLAGQADPESSLSLSRSAAKGVQASSAISPWIAQASRDDIVKLFPSLVADYPVPQAQSQLPVSMPFVFVHAGYTTRIMWPYCVRQVTNMFSIICKKSHFPKLAPAPPPRTRSNDEPSRSARGRGHAPTEPRTATVIARTAQPTAKPGGTDPPLQAAPPSLPPASTPPPVRSAQQQAVLAAAAVAAGAAPEPRCARCGKPVPASNAALHELHCQKAQQRAAAQAGAPRSRAAEPARTAEARPCAAASHELDASRRNKPAEDKGTASEAAESRPSSMHTSGSARSALESAGSARSFFAMDEDLGGELDSAKSLLDRMRSFLHASELAADPFGAAAKKRRDEAEKSSSSLAHLPPATRGVASERRVAVPADTAERAGARAARSGEREQSDTRKRMAHTMGSETRTPNVAEPVAKPPARTPLRSAPCRTYAHAPSATHARAARGDRWSRRGEAAARRKTAVGCANGRELHRRAHAGVVGVVRSAVGVVVVVVVVCVCVCVGGSPFSYCERCRIE